MLKVKIEGDKIFSPLRNNWFAKRSEEKVRQEYVCRLVNEYGYSLDQMGEEIVVTNSKRGTGRAQADIVIWRSKQDKEDDKEALIIVECKSDDAGVHPEDYWQAANYARMKGGKYIACCNTDIQKFFLTPTIFPNKLEEIVDIPKFEDINNEEKIKELEEATKVFTRDEFSKLLFTCHNVIRNNDKLSPEAAFDEISKILFIKIRYERNKTHIGKQKFSKERFHQLKQQEEETTTKLDKPYYQKLFDKTKEEFEKDGLFEPNEQINIRESSFVQIVELLQKYDLSNTSDDVKGIAFEQFLGKTFRGELGQFFTPRTIVNFMVEILDPQEGEVICDPCCGSGGFLIKAFEYIKSNIEKDIFEQKEDIKKCYFDEKYEIMSDTQKQKIDEIVEKNFAELNEELNNQKKDSRLWKLSHESIYGTDANPRMARVSKMNMIMHGDGHGGVHHNDGLININNVFENRFDIILTNPPFGSRVSKDHKISPNDDKYSEQKAHQIREQYGLDGQNAVNQVKNNIGKSLIGLYDTGKLSTLTEVLFMERYLRLLKKGGKMAVVLPEGFLNNPNLHKVREYFEGRAKIILITSIPSDVFIASGAAVKPSLVFLQKFTEDEENQYKVICEQETKRVRDELKITEIVGSLKKLQSKQYSGSKDDKIQKDVDKVIILELKETLKKKESEAELTIKQSIKDKFNYQIPIVEVQKAGISTTGQVIENELLDVVEEWKKYKNS